MNQLALTVIIIAIPVITACAAITGTIVGASLVGVFAYLMQKRALDFGMKVKSDSQPDSVRAGKKIG